MDSTLAYIDQASFLGLRALGRGPLVQLVWIYSHQVDLDALRRFNANLGHGLLGRRIERSAVPFGRHRWVTWPGPEDVAVAAAEIPRDQASVWADDQLRFPVDPEHGPVRRLAVAPLAGGGAVVTLIASHTTCDGLALCLSVAEAAQGVTRDLGYPPPHSRPRRRARIEDTRAALRAVPEMARAAAAAIKLARNNRDDFSASAARAAPPRALGGSQPVTTPALAVCIDEEQWDNCAETLGGTSNSLFAGIAARLGQLMGRVDENGQVKLSFPVSERTPGDTRGNALTGMMLTVDPAGAASTLAPIRAEIKSNLAALAQTRYELLAPLPLTPLVPARLAEKLEGMALGSGTPVGCSNLGRLDPAANRPDGTDADAVWIRQMESRTTPDILDRQGGTLFLASLRVHGRVSISVSGWQVGGPNTRERLTDLVRQVLAEFGLSGEVQ